MIKPRKAPAVGTWPADVPGGESALSRARYLAQQAIEELARYSGKAAEAFVRTAHAFGETWVTSHRTSNHDDWMTRDEAALFAGVKPRTISLWVDRGHIQRYPRGYSQSEIDGYLTGRRTKKEAKQTGQDG